MTRPTYQSGLLFTQAHKFVRGRIYDILEPYELNPSYWSILGAAIAAPDGIRLSNVAKAMDVKAPLVTMLSNDLIEKGLIKRIPHHTDKRAKLLVATLKGKRMALEIEMKLADEISQLLGGLSVSEINTFDKALEAIIQNAQRNKTNI